MSDDKQVKVRDHTFDGIQEFDNRLPNWWLWTLYGTIVFGIGYWILFHTLAVIPHPTGRYEADMKAAEEARLERLAAGGVNNESLELMATMPDQVAEGRKHFETYCVVCHADQGQGLVGPNLTDQYWIHGGAPMDVHRTVTDGVTAKGMAAWGSQLGPRRVEQVTAYVVSIRNTEVEGKAPEGELYTPGEETPAEPIAESSEPPPGDTTISETED
jgi:cytochrome c oxidase cbb3-type subunit 3